MNNQQRIDRLQGELEAYREAYEALKSLKLTLAGSHADIVPTPDMPSYGSLLIENAKLREALRWVCEVSYYDITKKRLLAYLDWGKA